MASSTLGLSTMVTASHYWTMSILKANGNLRSQPFPEAQRWIIQTLGDRLDIDLQGHDGSSPKSVSEPVPDIDPELDSPIDRHWMQFLWEMSQVGKHDLDTTWLAQTCLRCRLSHLIVAACRHLVTRFGATYQFTEVDLWRFVLDDDGKVPPAYPSLAIKILQQYQPDRGASLKTWATQLVSQNSDINQFLMAQGLYRITPWAILNDTKIAQLPTFLPYLSQGELDQATKLLHAYHQVYRRDRLRNHSVGSLRNSRCLDPTESQLRQINPHAAPNQVFYDLYDLAQQLRQARLARRKGGHLPTVSMAKMALGNPTQLDSLAAPATSDDQDEDRQTDFMERYRENFIATLDQSIQWVVQHYVTRYQKKKPPKGEPYHSALGLFHCQGYSMGAIATQLRLTNQVTVTRLLKLKQLRTEVCIHWLKHLKQTVEKQALVYLTAAQLDQIIPQLDQVLQEDIDKACQEAAAEAQIPKNRTTNSLFARRLCTVLPAITVQPSD